MKKIFAAVFSVFLISMLFSACSSGSSETSTSELLAAYLKSQNSSVSYSDVNLVKYLGKYTCSSKIITVTFNKISVDSTDYTWVFWFKGSDGHLIAAAQSDATHTANGDLFSFTTAKCDIYLELTGYGKLKYFYKNAENKIEYEKDSDNNQIVYSKEIDKSSYAGTYKGKLNLKNGDSDDIQVVVTTTSAAFYCDSLEFTNCDAANLWTFTSDYYVVFAVQNEGAKSKMEEDGENDFENNYTEYASAYLVFDLDGTKPVLYIPAMSSNLKENPTLTKE